MISHLDVGGRRDPDQHAGPAPPTGVVLWLTGLSGAGKSSVAEAAAAALRSLRVSVTVLDGDVLRAGLCRDLGFSAADRRENARRAREAAVAGALSGTVVLVALISPFASDRAAARARCEETAVPFAEIYVNAPLSECERRDPKHLYARARRGEIAAFTGISSPYEPPTRPELELHTATESLAQSAAAVGALALRLHFSTRR